MTNKLQLSWAPLILLIAVLGLFLHTLSYDFVYDDQWTIVHNQSLDQIQPVGRFFSDPNTVALPASGMQKDIYRPLQTLSFAITKNLFGSSPIPFRATNLIIHFINGWLLFLLLRRKGPLWASLLATLLFLCHPVQIESVIWISQRSILICTLGVLSTLLVWDKFSLQSNEFRLIYPLFLLALLGKETALLLPFLFLLWRPQKKKVQMGPIVTLLIIAGGYYLIRGNILGTWSQSKPIDDSILLRVGEGLAALGLYIKNIFWPFELNVSYQWPRLSPIKYTSFWIGLASLGGSLFVFWKHKKKKPLLAYGILFFFLFWIPHSGLTPLVTYAADRFLYLPMVGISFMVLFASKKWPKFPVFLFLITVLFVTSVKRTFVWQSEHSLWAASVQQDPDNSFAQFCFGQAFFREGNWDAAETHLEKSLALGATVKVAAGAMTYLAKISEQKNDFEKERIWNEKLLNLQSRQ